MCSRSKPGAGLATKRKQHSNKANVGCFCKRSRCLKKYCECFQAGVHCDATCKCEKCLNFPGSDDLLAAHLKQSKLVKRKSNSSMNGGLASNAISSPEVTLLGSMHGLTSKERHERVSNVSEANVASTSCSLFSISNGLADICSPTSSVTTQMAATERTITQEDVVSCSSIVSRRNNETSTVGMTHDCVVFNDQDKDEGRRRIRTKWARATKRVAQEFRDEAQSAEVRAVYSADRALAARAAAEALKMSSTLRSGSLNLTSSPRTTAGTTGTREQDRHLGPDPGVKDEDEGARNDTALAVAIRERTRTATVELSEEDEVKVAPPVATATYGAVLETRDGDVAQAAASWIHASARAALQLSASGGDGEAIERSAHDCARDTACPWQYRPYIPNAESLLDLPRVEDPATVERRALEEADKLEVLAANDVIVAIKAANAGDRAERRLISPNRSLLQTVLVKHDAHVKHLEERDGALLEKEAGIPLYKHIFVKTFQCLPSEDLFGSCLVNRKWSLLALDTALWNFHDDSCKFPSHDSFTT